MEPCSCAGTGWGQYSGWPETQIAFPRFKIARRLRHYGKRFACFALESSNCKRTRGACDETVDRDHTSIGSQLCQQFLIFARFGDLLQQHLWLFAAHFLDDVRRRSTFDKRQGDHLASGSLDFFAAMYLIELIISAFHEHVR